MEVCDRTVGHKPLRQQVMEVFMARTNQNLPKIHLQKIDQKMRHLRASLIPEEASATSVPEPSAWLLALLAPAGVSAQRQRLCMAMACHSERWSDPGEERRFSRPRIPFWHPTRLAARAAV